MKFTLGIVCLLHNGYAFQSQSQCHRHTLTNMNSPPLKSSFNSDPPDSNYRKSDGNLDEEYTPFLEDGFEWTVRIKEMAREGKATIKRREENKSKYDLARQNMEKQRIDESVVLSRDNDGFNWDTRIQELTNEGKATIQRRVEMKNQYEAAKRIMELREEGIRTIKAREIAAKAYESAKLYMSTKLSISRANQVQDGDSFNWARHIEELRKDGAETVQQRAENKAKYDTAKLLMEDSGVEEDDFNWTSRISEIIPRSKPFQKNYITYMKQRSSSGKVLLRSRTSVAPSVFVTNRT
mmetsp:Transcript_38210/g.51719  ORF Transcript_38210/g.51719 Transcript_38210/m.51719 type:complete len:295 (-) Transcript_38210:319-1203(-)